MENHLFPQDNASHHKSKMAMETMSDLGFVLLDQSAYSPQPCTM